MGWGGGSTKHTGETISCMLIFFNVVIARSPTATSEQTPKVDVCLKVAEKR